MNKIEKEADLPYSCKDIFNAVADYARFPEIFPVLRSAKILDQQQNSADVEMAFNVPPAMAAFLSGTTQTMHATLTPDNDILMESTSGALKKINIHWTFNEIAPGKTHVKFTMDYDTGMNAAVGGTVKIFINMNTKNIMQQLDGHMRKRAAAGPR